MFRLIFSLPLLFASSAHAVDRPPAPSPDCLDARQISEFHQPDALHVAVASADQRRFMLMLAERCPAASVARQSSLWAKDGWVCGTGREFLQADETQCAIGAVRPLDAREYAAAVKESDLIKTMSTVHVTAGAQKGFIKSPEYCFVPRFIRSWSEEPNGVTVSVSRRHPGDYRNYRIELAGSCRLYNAREIMFRSGMDNGVICGNSGDQLLVLQESLTPISTPTSTGCQVVAVYPRGGTGD